MTEPRRPYISRTKAARVGIWIPVALVILFGLWRLRFDVDVLNLLPADLPAVQGLKLYQKHFAKAHELIVTLETADADSAEAAARSLADRLRGEPELARSAVWQPPWMEQPRDAAEFVAYLWFNADPELLSALTNELSGANLVTRLQATRQQLATTLSPDELARLPYDPLGLMRLPDDGGSPASVEGRQAFASADGLFRIVLVQARGDLRNYREAAAWLDRLQGVVEGWKKADPVAERVLIQYTGSPAFTAEIARGMERDTTKSVLGTLGVIAVLFWFAHRQLRPLLWLLCLMVLILLGTLAVTGLLIGTLNVVSIGFAAILLGLAVDYALVLFQEWRSDPALSVADVRRHIGPGIFWSAVTTAGAFATLNLGGLPGLGQLGTMVAIGIALAAAVMLYGYLPPLMGHTSREQARTTNSEQSASQSRKFSFTFAMATAVLLLVIVATLSRGLPRLDASSEALRPRDSAAYSAMQEVQARIGGEPEPVWLLVSGASEGDVGDRLKRVERVLNHELAEGRITGFDLPTSFWQNSRNKIRNVPTLSNLVSLWPNIKATALAQGFSTNSLFMTEAIFSTWKKVIETPPDKPRDAFLASNQTAQWIFGRLVAEERDRLLAAGMIHGVKSSSSLPVAELQKHGALVAGWDALGKQLFSVVAGRTWKLVLPMLAVLGLSLWLAFRRVTELALSLATLALAFFCLLAVMRLAGWSWNLMNLMVVPLLLGTGVDYSIHVQAALRRFNGDAKTMRRVTGRALWLCGGTTVTAFASLGFSSNAGLASLGYTCAAGVACAMLIALYILPALWSGWAGRGQVASALTRPSGLYRRGFWRLGQTAARYLPMPVCASIMTRLAKAYWLLVPRRRNIVIENLLPALGGNRAEAKILGRDLLANFGIKLVDLWRFETGRSDESLLVEESGWEHLVAARANGRGVLVVTPHLGNWEFGGPLLISRGIKLHVVTQVEPGQGFTELRREARARWGIDTHVIGDHPFAVVEVIKLLEGGAVVALLMDRPPAATAVTVELFGRPFPASLAAAELARASGCAVLPVALPRLPNGYGAYIYPEISYDRAALSKREARCELTQRIVRAFEPVIRQYLDQWYHFVPIWPR